MENSICLNSCACSTDYSGTCGCVGYAYVSEQAFGETYCPETGLTRGTIFPELDLDIDEYGKICRQWRDEE